MIYNLKGGTDASVVCVASESNTGTLRGDNETRRCEAASDTAVSNRYDAYRDGGSQHEL